MKRPKMIFFDYGGTLVNESAFDFTRGEREVFRHVVRNPYHKTFEEVSHFETDFYASLQKVRDTDYEPHEMQMLHYKYEYFDIELDISYEKAEEILWAYTAPVEKRNIMPGAAELLQYLKKEGIRTGVISNMGWPQNCLKERLREFFPEHEFEIVLASSEYGIRKPDTRLFDLGLRKAGLSADRVWFVGDLYDKDVIGARNTGMRAFLYRGTMTDGPKRSPEIPRDIRNNVIFDHRELIRRLCDTSAICE